MKIFIFYSVILQLVRQVIRLIRMLLKSMVDSVDVNGDSVAYKIVLDDNTAIVDSSFRQGWGLPVAGRI